MGWTLAAAAGLALAAAAPASAIGPTLGTNPADRDRAVRCPAAFSGAHEPVLFIHGTAGRSEDHWALGYQKVLPDQGFDVCTVRLPDLALGDIQIASEYVVHAVRAIAERSGKKVDVVGYSQGGLEPRWAVKFWLDVRYAVDDLVTLASPHHGALSPDGLCATGSCHPAVWQMKYTGSSFIAALNTGDETPGPIDYTSIYSLDDDLVQPAAPTPTAALAGGTNIQIQDVCAGRSVSHGTEPFDAVAYALVVDALTHPGPASPSRVLAEHPDLCTQVFTPGLTPDDGAIAQEVVYANGLEAVALFPGQTNAEPAPASYVPEPSFIAGLAASIALLTWLDRRSRRATTFAAALGIALAASPPASADGPTLETNPEDLDRAIQCPIAFSGAHEPILFVHGTAGRPEDHWALDYQKILPDMGFDVCTVRLPDFALGDIQTSTEYVVHAVRYIAAASGRQVDMVGYSQGGLEPRWAVKYWPDVRAAVDDIVTLATPHHGTILGDAACAGGTCDPAVWQMRPGANFIASLNTIDETPGAIDYTSIYSIHDELVQPVLPVPTAELAGGTAILIQDVCPGRFVNHGAEPIDAAVFALTMDALTHPGPADPARVLAEQPDLCTQTYLPGLTPDDGATAEEVIYGNGGETLLSEPDVSAEPPLRPYAIPVALVVGFGFAGLLFHRRSLSR
jgi:triacylglycerol esterase/lipase EstA (alpha/beta hydrolase family)